MEFKLFDFNLYEETKHDSDSENDGDHTPFIIQMFGLNEKGKSCSIFVENFKPFFYIKVGEDWTEKTKQSFVELIKHKIGPYFAKTIVETKFVQKKQLYGFDAGKEYKFIYIQFLNKKGFNKVQNLWYKYDNNTKERTINKSALRFKDCYTEMYESNIPPLLRFFHIHEISPSGWIRLLNTNKNKFKITNESSQISNCDYEYRVNTGNIKPLNDKETSISYKIMSFDIEASSSHGDFPIPKKSYKKLATNMMEYIENKNISSDNLEDELKKMILTAFDFQKISFIEKVYPKNKKITKSAIDEKITTWLKCVYDDDSIQKEMNTIESMFEKMAEKTKDGDDDDDADEFTDYKSYKNPAKKQKPYLIADLIGNSDIKREDKIKNINWSLTKYFPPLEGDKVTFIGSTFQHYGETEPYLNNCIVVNSCTQLSSSKTEIVCVDEEKDLLLEWRNLVQKEQPDIIIGYNIFGFDYSFMMNRAEECNCVEEFLKLSRNKNEVCGKYSDKGFWEIEKSVTTVASGTYDLSYIKMAGRIQVDMYNWFRKTENLSSYKLDYVGSHFIGDYVNKLELVSSIVNITEKTEKTEKNTKVYSKNLTGLSCDNYIHFELQNHSIDSYKENKKCKVIDVNKQEGWFIIEGVENPEALKVKWGLAKDDVSPKDIFRLTNEGQNERSIIAKYCIQDCNLVHHLFTKVDVITDLVEMARLCSVPISFLIMRGQGIKLTSFVAKKCQEKNTLMPVIEKGNMDDGYEGAIVLDPKCKLYLDAPIAVGDFASLYPSSMLSENLCPSSKVYAKTYDLQGKLLSIEGNEVYDNLPNYEYVDITFDTFKYVRKTPKSKADKIKNGYKICRFAQYKEGKAIMPSILEELLNARKSTRKQIPLQTDDFIKNILDKRQLAYKVTANSLYGQLGAKTSTFYEPDIAASTTATGRLLLTFAKSIVEECYKNKPIEIHGKKIVTNAEYVYGDTDSVFFNFNIKEADTLTPIVGKEALAMSIEIAQEACSLVSSCLKEPHDFEYEKTFMPFCLLSKKRYVGILYETDPNKGKRKEMGIVLKRRDNAPIVKDIYGGVIDILMKEQNIKQSLDFVHKHLQHLVEGKINVEKLIISKSLNSFYKLPKQIAHKVLADRIGERDSGNKPSPGDRIPFIYIVNTMKGVLQGDKIETPSYIKEHNIPIDFSFYISNQIMKPLLQLFGLILEDIWAIQHKPQKIKQFKKDIMTIESKHEDEKKIETEINKLREKEVKALLFDKYLRETNNKKAGNQSILTFFKS